jgi:hypothetical protein
MEMMNERKLEPAFQSPSKVTVKPPFVALQIKRKRVDKSDCPAAPRGNLAIHCQEEMKSDGRLAAHSCTAGAPEYGASVPSAASCGNLAIHCQEEMKSDGRLAAHSCTAGAPEYGTSVPSAASRGNQAIHCQEDMKSDGRLGFDDPGAEAPDSGRS